MADVVNIGRTSVWHVIDQWLAVVALMAVFSCLYAIFSGACGFAVVGEPRESDPLALPLAGKPDGSGYADPAGIFRAFHVLFF